MAASRSAVIATFVLVALAAFGAAPVEGLGSSRNVRALTDKQYTAAVRPSSGFRLSAS